MMASGMLGERNDGEWNVGMLANEDGEWNVGMASGMLVTDGEWNVGE